MGYGRVWIGGLGLLLLTGCAALQAPAPARRPAAVRIWEVPASTLVIPVRVPWAQVKAWTEAAVPATVKGEGKGQKTLSAWFLKHDWHYTWAYDLKRTPLSLGYSGSKLRVASSLTGTLAAQWDTLPGDISSEVEADAGVETDLVVGPDWRLKPNSKVFLDVRRADVPIGISWDGNFFGETISIAGPVQDALRPSLDKLGAEVDQRLAAFDLRSPVDQLWRNLQEPRSLAGKEPLWFDLGPRTVALGPLEPSMVTLGLTLTLSARPTLSLGTKPDPARVSLPSAGVAGPTTPKMVLNLPVSWTWDEAARQALARLPADRVIPVGNGAKITLATLSAATDGDRVQLQVTGKVSPPWPGPAVEAVFYLSGVPRWDPVARTLRMTGTALDVQTRDFLTQAASWMLAGTWVQDLEKSMVWNLGPVLDGLRTQASEALAAVEVAPHVRLSVALDRLEVADFALTDHGALALARVEGVAAVVWVP